MTHQEITLVNNMPALLLSPEVLESLGIEVGDKMEVVVENQTLVLRPLNGTERKAKMDAAMLDLLERRRTVYEKLAEGA